MRRLAVVIFSVLAVAAMLVMPVQAITFGTYDGNKHPEVGGVVEMWKGQPFLYCSGTLISPTVFLTAAHCYPDTTPVYVTFDPDFSGKSKLYQGTFYADPAYPGPESDPHDIAVIVLDKPVTNITPAKLPKAGSLDKLYKDQKFTAVGYGGQYPVNQPGGPVIAYLDKREWAVSTLDATNPAWLRLSQNPAKGDGGACYGDSGGPNFLGSGSQETTVIAGTTITGDAMCKATNVIYRLDTLEARSFLGQFVTLP